MKKSSYHLTNTIVYQSKNGSLELKADMKYETIWLHERLASKAQSGVIMQ